MKNEIITLLVKVNAKSGSIEKTKAALWQDVQGAWTETGNCKTKLYNTIAIRLLKRMQTTGALIFVK